MPAQNQPVMLRRAYNTDLAVGVDAWRWKNVGIEPNTSMLVGVEREEVEEAAEQVYPVPSPIIE